MRLSVFIVAAVCLAIQTEAGLAQEPARVLSGRALQHALQAELTLTVRDASARDLLHTLQRDTGIPIVLDRRVDPGADPGTYAGSLTITRLLRQIAEALECGISFPEDFVYIGPKPAAERLRTLMQLHRQDVTLLRGIVAADGYRALVTSEPSSWPRLAKPRVLLMNAAAGVGLQIRNPATIPHDLWRHAGLPRMPFADRATVILNQFDLAFEFAEQGRALRIVPVPEVVTVEQSHRVASGRKEAVGQRWRNQFPDLTIVWQGATARVSATVEQHEQLQALMRDP